MRDQRESQGRDPSRRHSAPAALPGKSNLVDSVPPAPAGVGKQTRVELIADGAQLRSSMVTTVAAVAGRSSSAAKGDTGKAPAEAGSSSGDAELEQTLMALQQSMSRMQGHLDEWETRFGPSEVAPEAKGKAVADRAPTPESDPDGRAALASLTASLERMQALLVELGPPSPAERPGSPIHDTDAVIPPSPDAIELPTRPAPAHLRPPTAGTQDPTPDLDPHPNQHPDIVRQNADHDLNKRVFKALSYGGAAVGTAGSFAGWVASHWVGTKIQQTSQTAGGLAKNVVGALGDYHDSQEKATHDPPGASTPTRLIA